MGYPTYSEHPTLKVERIYVASSWRNDYQPSVVARLRMDAQDITVKYAGNPRTPTALEFRVDTVYGVRTFRLPSRIDGVLELLVAHWENTKAKTKRGRPGHPQAVRVAWRILKEWAGAQLALVQIGMVSTDEIMLPYMLVGPDRTVYEDYAERQRALPEGGR